MPSLAHFGEAYLLGLSVAAPIGPVNIAIINRALRVGPRPAFLLGCGAVTIDSLYFTLSIFAADQANALIRSVWIMRLVLFFGGGLLAWLGWGSIQAAAPNLSEAPAPIRGTQGMASYLIGLGMTAANPLTIGLWLSIAAGFSAAGIAQGNYVLRIGGVAAGALSWVVFLVSLLARTKRWFGPTFLRWVNIISGVVLIGFGGVFWLRAVAY